MENIAAPSQHGVEVASNFRLTSVIVALLGLLAMAVPTMVSIAQDHWATEYGVHGPIILATGAWLIWRERKMISAERRELTSALWAVPVLIFGLVWLFARTFAILSVESLALYFVLLTATIVYLGPQVARKLWFPFLYLAFLIVPPGSLIDELTQPLKMWISAAAVDLLSIVGYPVANTGAIIQVGQYQLLVADACAGLMSLLSLTAIGLFYNYLNSGNDAKRAAVLLTAIIPMAVLANLIRVVALVLLTYHAGSQVAQGFMHDMAGLFTFSVALAGMFLADSVYTKLFVKER
ncbi:exosortase V [Croceibacterium ferulae]|uniref:exosortase V n=1 Tax=Croceibacterium ferulae TaxID=1854641 RepID=UPI00139058C4|nr:exosortase V [Croceibacterium ferulae]